METRSNRSRTDQPQFSLRAMFAVVTGFAVIFGIVVAIGAPMVHMPAAFAVCGAVAWLTIQLIGVNRRPLWDRFLPRSARAAGNRLEQTNENGSRGSDNTTRRLDINQTEAE